MAATNETSSQVRVGVRIRPITSKESSEGGKVVAEANAFDRTVGISKRKFTYDSVFHSNVSNEELYNNVAPPLLDAFLNGYNATILAYGQTGSGKTYTMGSEAGGLNESAGLIPRFLSGMFTTLFERKSASVKSALRSPSKTDGSVGNSQIPSLIDFRVSASFLEVYGEDIYDLLDEDRTSLKLREDTNGQVFVVGLRKNPVVNADDAMGILNTGTMNRTTAATLMNCTSSRSHAVFTIHLKQTTRTSEGVDITTTSCMTFVDLAGSERMKKTGAEGERMKEGIKINEGLLALGNVINALGDDERLEKGEKVHVPYRQSKLTRLLQDALGGNSQTLFLACVSPSDTNASETISTLQYANRARNIKNAPTRNVDAAALELQRLRALASILKCELIKHRFDAKPSSPDHENEKVNEHVIQHSNLGVVNETLFARDDVLAYLSMIDEKVAELSGVSPNNAVQHSPMTTLTPTPTSSTYLNISNSLPNLDINQRQFHTEQKLAPRVTPTISSVEDSNHPDDDDDSDVNPDEDFAIVDELIERQRRDQEKLDKMDIEIEEQEERLIQLRDHLKVYVNMKEKYESLLREVNNLEAEKEILMRKLEKAQVDPTKGCSVAIQQQLEEVKANLIRARTETRKHQQLYRKAEQEAKKCHVLESKIEEMKRAKVALLRKQKEDAAKHKECTNQKTQEIKELKRREKNTDKKVQKLEAECQRYKANLERSQSRYDKLADKLKQTEATLTRLLTKRRHDLNRITANSQRSTSACRNLQQDLDESTHIFAPECGEVISLKFVLEKIVKDRVDQTQCRRAYEVKMAEHEKLMMAMSKEVKLLNQRKKESRELEHLDPDHYDELVLLIRELEENVQGYLIQIELVEDDLEKLRARWPSVEHEFSDNNSICMSPRKEESTKQMLSRLEAPVLR
ncbi:hypothetical protein HJC23_005077 [Cyclotella cryptica]|uniref:Kinesin motor domain-containing protein n=1 Tax=Cyclotella cryptica TaxID=29204 RepID=A0ABD3QEG6_9STRA